MKLSADFKREERGSITVFLSMILLLIFAMCAALIQGARLHTGRQRQQLVLENAVDAAFSRYFLPLYENYHVFFLNQGIDTDTLSGEEFLDSIREYIYYGMSTEDGDFMKGIDLYKDGLEALELMEVETAVGREGNIFKNEVLEYMKYKAGESVLEDMLEKMDLFSAARKTGKVLEYKLAAEEAMGLLDEILLDEIKNIDGVIFKKNGTIAAAEYFGKKFSNGGNSMGAVGINNSIVYSVMSPEYVNPVKVMKNIESDARSLKGLIGQREKLEEQLREPENKENKGSGGSNKTNDKKTAKIKKKLKEINKKIKAKIKAIRENKKRVTDPLAGMEACLQRAGERLPELEKKQREIKERLGQYEKALSENEGQLPGETYDSLLADLNDKKAYAGSGNTLEVSMIEKVLNMEPVLKDDQRVIQEFAGYKNVDFTEDEASIEAFIEETEKYREIIVSYEIRPLSFDYTGVEIKEKVDSPLEAMQGFLEEGILALVIPEGMEVSEKTLKQGDRLRSVYANCEEAEKEEPEMKNSLKGTDKGYNSGLTDSAGQFGEDNWGKEIAESLLINQYIKEHTIYFPIKGTGADEKVQEASDGEEGESRSGLLYETEYIIQGKACDKDNLLGVINRILFTRTMLNFVAVLTDSEKRSLAYSTASALIGFTGMEPLIILTQTLILIAWAYEEAVVDTAALLLGKPVPILKAPGEFQMQYTDLLLISPGVIRQKAKAMPDTAASLSINYEEFLFITLLGTSWKTRCFRLMDLADACGKKYDEGFEIEKCVFAAEVRAEFKMPGTHTCYHSY